MPTSDRELILSVEGVSAGYGQRLVLHRICLGVAPGEFVAVIGLNGAGKSTLLRAIVGYLRAEEGQIRLLGENVVGLEPYQISRRGVAYVPQDHPVFPDLSVGENLRLGGWTLRRRAERDAAEGRMFQLFPRLKERSRQRASTLSGGERQMLALARALVTNPALVLLDEPLLGLAPTVVEEVFRALRTINEAGVAILVVEQNAKKALSCSHRAYVMEMGKITLQGPSAELLERSEIRNTYLGRET